MIRVSNTNAKATERKQYLPVRNKCKAFDYLIIKGEPEGPPIYY
jgi:hypothetical protein